MKKYIGIFIFILLIIGAVLLAEPLNFNEPESPISPVHTPTSTVDVLIPTKIIPTATSTVTPTPSATPTSTSTSTVVPTKVPTEVVEVPTSLPTPIGHFFYTIERGDNLWNIAVRVYEDGTKYIWICEANNLTHNCSLIHADNMIWIPGYFPEE